MSNLSSNGLSRVLAYLKTWITGLLNGKSDTSHTHTKSQITDFPAIRTDILHFATVSSLDANTISEDGIWYVYGGINGAPMSNHGVLVYVKSVGTPFQMYFPDNLLYVYKRIYTSGAWGSWEKMNSRSWDDIQYINGYKVYVG